MSESQLKQLVQDHEDRIRKLEKTQMELKYNLLSLDNDVKDLKIMMQDFSKNQSDLIKTVVEAQVSISTNNNKNLWDLIFKVGSVLAPFVSAGLAIYIK